MDSFGEILIYQTEDGLTKLDVRMEDETVWLTQQQMAELFQTSRTNVVDHIKNIYEDGELDENSTCRKFRQVRMEGNRQVTRELPFYNLDMIISLGYRVKSSTATHFRKWATQPLKEYIIKGFKEALNVTTKDYLDYIVNEIHRTIGATVDDEGLPVTAAIDMMDSDENGLYFLTAKGILMFRKVSIRSENLCPCTSLS